MNENDYTDTETDTLSYAWDINDLLVADEPDPEEAYDMWLSGEINEDEFFAIVRAAEEAA